TAFSGTFRRPPQDTHQVLDVAAYLKNRPVQWLVLPDLTKELGSNYEKYDEGSIGQLDTRILVEQYADKETAQDMAKAWRSGAYYAAVNKDSKVTGTAKIGLLYLSRWDSDESADEFAKLYGDYLGKRYAKVHTIPVKDVKCSGNCDSTNVHAFETDEGSVWIERVEGSGVLVSEGFDVATGSKVRTQVLAANPAKSVQVRKHTLMSPLQTSAVLKEAMGRIIAERIVEALHGKRQ
ncbi:MAG TPA: hypothetical protein VM912_00350, partial [Terriglobales bacterium]|nr:hypothetical protein [Terriglobales bacterium]